MDVLCISTQKSGESYSCDALIIVSVSML